MQPKVCSIFLYFKRSTIFAANLSSKGCGSVPVKNRRDTHTGPYSKALVYDILPSTTAVFSYAIGSRKLSANEQFFVGAQTVVSLLQTTQIKQGVSFIAANKVYTSTNKTTIVWIETELYPLWMRLMFTCVLWRKVASTVILGPEPFGGRWHSSGAVWESRWTSWAVRPNEPSGFRGRKELFNRASALVTTCL